MSDLSSVPAGWPLVVLVITSLIIQAEQVDIQLSKTKQKTVSLSLSVSSSSG